MFFLLKFLKIFTCHLQRFEYKLNISKEKTSGCDDDLSTCDDLTTMVR
jgi:hypothetical protein